jgi:colicin import membrane protein
MALGGRDRAGEDGFPETYRDDWRADRVTVLLVLAPGTYGIRRHGPKVADPVLCTPVGCYVSEGADRPARFMPGRKALGFGNTWGSRAGACRQRLGCVFRAIELGRLPAYLQPVDLHILKHDRRRPHEVAGDSACRASGGRLLCGRGIYADDYVMWIVPERQAEAAGAEALERAVREGLNGPRSADIFPLLGR